MVSFILHMQERDKTGHALLYTVTTTASTTRRMYFILSAVALRVVVVEFSMSTCEFCTRTFW